jgi:hypothetical protein
MCWKCPFVGIYVVEERDMWEYKLGFIIATKITSFSILFQRNANKRPGNKRIPPNIS